jgi:hypothetical protein
VHLDPDAVELRVDGGRRAGGGQRLGHVGRALRQHRRQRAADLEREAGQRLRAAVERRGGHVLEVPGEQQRAADGRRLHRRRPRDRVGQQPGLRALPQLAAEQAGEQALLVGRRRREQGVHKLPPAGLRADPGHRRDLPDGGIDGGDGQRGLTRGGRQVPQAGPADAGLPLPQLAREVRRAGRDLVRRQAAQRGGQ